MTRLWGCRIFTGSAAEIIEFGQVAFADGKIVEVKSLPADAAVPEFDVENIDARGMTALPGLIDCEAYLSLDGGVDAYDRRVAVTSTESAFWVIMNAREYLRRGFTTVRDGGDRDYETIVIRDAIKEGRLIGPKLHCSGPIIRSTCGFGNAGIECSGPDEARHAVRKLFQRKVEWVKVIASSNRQERGKAAVDYPEMLPDEIRAITAVAQNYKKKVAAHVQNEESILHCIDNGVFSISHGTELTDRVIDKLLQVGAWVVPVFSPCARVVSLDGKKSVSEETYRFSAAVMEKKESLFNKAVKAGVNIAYGSGAGMDLVLPAKASQEMGYMISAGMCCGAALEAATSKAAMMLGIEDKTGSLRTGLAADILVVSGNPMEDVRALSSVRYVFQDGRLMATEKGLEDVSVKPVIGD